MLRDDSGILSGPPEPARRVSGLRAFPVRPLPVCAGGAERALSRRASRPLDHRRLASPRPGRPERNPTGHGQGPPTRGCHGQHPRRAAAAGCGAACPRVCDRRPTPVQLSGPRRAHRRGADVGEPRRGGGQRGSEGGGRPSRRDARPPATRRDRASGTRGGRGVAAVFRRARASTLRIRASGLSAMADTERVVDEIFRVVCPGGRVAIADAHRVAWRIPLMDRLGEEGVRRVRGVALRSRLRRPFRNRGLRPETRSFSGGALTLCAADVDGRGT